jgi:hypothetical protein
VIDPLVASASIDGSCAQVVDRRYKNLSIEDQFVDCKQLVVSRLQITCGYAVCPVEDLFTYPDSNVLSRERRTFSRSEGLRRHIEIQ